MRKMLSVASVILLFFITAYAYGFSAKGQDCSKCHTLKKDEALALLKNLDQNIKVLNVRKSQAKYLWEIEIESNGKKALVYIDLPKKYLFSGSLIEIREKKNLTQDSLSELRKVNVSQIPLKDSILLGERNAKRRVIVFDDPD